MIFLGHFLLFHWMWQNLTKATVTIGSLINSQEKLSFVIADGSLNNQDMIKILKQSGHGLTGKCVCEGYFMDVM